MGRGFVIFDRYRFNEQVAMELGEKILLAIVALILTWLIARAAKWAFAKLVDAVPMIGPIGAMIGGIAEAARGGAVALLLHASDASEDGRKKLDQAWRVGRELEGSGERGVELPLDRDALSVALGRDNVVHLALADEAAAARVMKALTRLTHYLGHDLPAADGRVSARADDELND